MPLAFTQGHWPETGPLSLSPEIKHARCDRPGMKRNDIHGKLVKRLLLVWVTLSVVIGGVVFYLEMKKAEDMVLKLALTESQDFTADSLNHLNRPGVGHEIALRRKAEVFLKRHFIVIKLYDRDKREVLRATAAGAQLTIAMLERHRHVLPLSDTPQHSAAFIEQRVLMHVLLPLTENGGRVFGYFDGVYQVDDETIAHVRGNVLGALAQAVLATLVVTATLYPVIISLNRELIKYSLDLLKGNVELMQVLGSAVALRDSDTGAHNYRVTIYAARLAEAIGLPTDRMRKLIAGAFLHDVGKIGISDNILLKPGVHVDEESRRMRSHVTLGVEMLEKSEWLQHARDVVECHHEKYDGSGYPRGLTGEAIPLTARIFAIVDVFDALVSRRPYKEPFGLEQAIDMLARERGHHFDPALLDAFIRIAPALYAEFHAADYAALKRMLNAVVARYFFPDLTESEDVN